MFNSLASFLFGSNTNCETNSETTATATATGVSEQSDTDISSVDVDNFIKVTSLTPSVTGAGDKDQGAIRRDRKKHNNGSKQNKRRGKKAPLPPRTTQTTPPTPGDTCEEEFDEDDWFIVEKEDAKVGLSPTCTDSEGDNISIIGAVEIATLVNAVADSNQQQRFEHTDSHSRYSGPRPQKERNFLHKTRSNTSNRRNKGLSISTLSPSRTVNYGGVGSDYEDTADGGVTQSLCVDIPSSSQPDDELTGFSPNGLEIACNMEESWFVTPPPCFTSTGPVDMETSPYENLLIEHPSMSVYHCIKTANDASPSFIKLDIDVSDEAENQEANKATSKKLSKRNSQVVQSRSSGTDYNLNRQSVALLKKELTACNEQKIQTKKEYRDFCRNAILRANKVRDIQSRNHTKRRSDNQHSKVFSNANNNRKTNCC